MSELKELLINISEEKQTKIIPENIKSGVQIFDVVGNFTGDATATAEDVLKDKTFYANGEKHTGTLEVSINTNNARVSDAYAIANNKTQLTLSQSIDYVDYSGIDGSRFTSFMNLFQFTNSLRGCALPKQTSQVTDLTQMFYYCSVLEDVPYFDASSVTKMNNFVWGSTTNLTDESLNNILAICASATKMSASNKKLSVLGEFTTEQINKMKTMPNYQAFANAGWTTS